MPLTTPPAPALRRGAPSPSVPRPRSPALDLDAPIPRHWFGDNAFATHVLNGVNLLFPAGERFFVRSVKRYADRLADPILVAQVKGFFGQEGRHAREHERVIELLEAQGFSVAPFLRVYERIAFGALERLTPPSLRLATTAACEHFTAILAENALELRMLDRAHPTMRDLYLWHAAEEIEHRAVAFDVLREVAPSYALRVAGLVVASACLAGFWLAGTATLMAQDDALTVEKLRVGRRAARQWRRGRTVFVPGIREYLRRDFHPLQRDIDALARDHLVAAGLA